MSDIVQGIFVHFDQKFTWRTKHQEWVEPNYRKSNQRLSLVQVRIPWSTPIGIKWKEKKDMTG